MDVRSSRDQVVPIALAQKLRDVKKNVKEVKEVAEAIAEARSTRQRVIAVARLLDTVCCGEPARIVARLLICAYYINIVYSKVEAWQQLLTPEAQARTKRWTWDDSAAAAAAALPFPYPYMLVLLPAAVLAAVHVVLPWVFSATLLLFTVLQDVWITWGHLRNFILHTGRPSELLVKQLAMIACAALLLAYSLRGSPQLRRVTAGMLRAEGPRSQQGHHNKWCSAVLLLGRLLLGLMLMVLGYQQVLRIQAHLAQAASGSPPPPLHFGRQDARDNNWLLLECILAIPLALGLCISAVTRLLFVVLLTESFLQWGWWGSGWPSWHYRAHVRDHFFVNNAVAGGLLLMQSFGAGMFTADSLLAKQD